MLDSTDGYASICRFLCLMTVNYALGLTDQSQDFLKSYKDLRKEKPLLTPDITVVSVAYNEEWEDVKSEIRKEYSVIKVCSTGLFVVIIALLAQLKFVPQDIVQSLGVVEVVKHAKYLGLPTSAGRSKKAAFAFIKDRMWKRLNSWQGSSLSRAGKETLVKSVLQSIPTYLIGVYLLPQNLIHEIHMLIARFWWGSTSDHAAMHWLSWEKMCLPKKLGGMGFRDLSVFNLALLAKQGWRLLTSDHCLVARVLKARYFSNGNFLSAAAGNRPSYIWRSIWSAKSLLQQGIGWRIGNGTDVLAASTSWIPDGKSLRPPAQLSNVRADLVVSELINHGTSCWNETLIRAEFCPADIGNSPYLETCRRYSHLVA